MTPQTFKYSLNSWYLVLMLLFSSSVSTIFFIKASTNHQGLIINHLIELSVFQSTIFFWIFFAFSSIFLLIGLMALYKKFTTNYFIELYEDKIVIPPNSIFSKKFREVYFADITTFHEYSISSNTFFTIEYLSDKVNINKSMLSKEDYDFLKYFISFREHL